MQFQFKYIIILLFLLSCRSQEKGSPFVSESIKLGAIKVTNDNEAAKVSDVNLIPLELTKDCPISAVKKVLYKNERFYIQDLNQNNEVYFFSKDGSYAGKISRNGKGPDEYTSLTDFDIDEEGNIYIWDLATQHLFKFDPKGFLTNKKHIDKVFLNFKMLESRKILFSRLLNSELIYQGLEIYDLEQGIEYFSAGGKREFYDDSRMLNYNNYQIFSSDSSAYVSFPFSPSIYRFTLSGNLKLFEFEDFKIPSEEKAKYYLGRSSEMNEDDNYVKAFGNIYENSQYIIMNVFKKRFPYFVKISKRNRTQTYFSYLLAGVATLGQVSGVMNDRFFTVVNARFISDENLKNYLLSPNINEDLRKKLLVLNADSNPIIISYLL